MEQRFEFEGAEVLALVEESRSAAQRLMTEAQRMLAAGVDLTGGEIPEDVDHPGTGAEPGLWLMNDHGVYLRSNAEGGGERRAWARGFRAEIPVGDDPMCEFVDAAQLAPLQAGDVLVITLQEHRMRLSLLRPA